MSKPNTSYSIFCVAITFWKQCVRVCTMIDSGDGRSYRQLFETLHTRALEASSLFHTPHIHLLLLMFISDKPNAGVWQRRDGVRNQETKACLHHCPDDVACVLGFDMLLYSRFTPLLALSSGSYRSNSLACDVYVPLFHVDLYQKAPKEKPNVVVQRFSGLLGCFSQRFAFGCLGYAFGSKGFACKLLQSIKHSCNC